MSNRFANRFWASSTSEDEATSDSESQSEESVESVKAAPKSKYIYDSDDESEEEKRVVKPPKVKFNDDMTPLYQKIKNAIKINDWNLVNTSYEAAKKLMDDKLNSLFGGEYPTLFLRLIVLVEDGVNGVDKNTLKGMKKPLAMALTKLKQNLKKNVPEALRNAMTSFRENPPAESEEENSSDESDNSDSETTTDSSESDEDSDEDSDDESNTDEEDSEDEEESEEDESEEESESGSESESESSSESGSESESSSESESESESSSSSDSSDSESSSDFFNSSSSSESEEEEPEQYKKLTGRAKWVLRPDEIEKEKQSAEKKQKSKKTKEQKATKQQTEKVVAKKVEVTIESVDDLLTVLIPLVGNRPRNANERTKKINTLTKYARISQKFDFKYELRAYSQLISSLLEFTIDPDLALPINIWQQCYMALSHFTELLLKHTEYTLEPVQVNFQLAMTLENRIAEEKEFLEANPRAIHIEGNLLSYIERLAEEYNKSLRLSSSHGTHYIARLRDEYKVLSLAIKIQDYFNKKRQYAQASTLALLRLKYIYYQSEEIYQTMAQNAHLKSVLGDLQMMHPACMGTPVTTVETMDPSLVNPAACSTTLATLSAPQYSLSEAIEQLYQYIYKYGDESSKQQALLCKIYYLCFHDRYEEARDLLLMSKIQDQISTMTIDTAILFNRTIAQFGLCAFRQGDFYQCKASLSDLCNVKNNLFLSKSLLGQGADSIKELVKNPNYDEEKRRLDERRKLPFHLHIDGDLIESCYLISCMYYELQISSNNNSILSRNTLFSRIYDRYTKNSIDCVPENSVSKVVNAAKEMKMGNWRKGYAFLTSISSFNLWSSEKREQVFQVLLEKTKILSLICFLYKAPDSYLNFTCDQLVKMFELPAEVIRTQVSTLMIHKDISASWDGTSDAIVFYNDAPTRLETLSLNLTHKIIELREANNKVREATNNENNNKEENMNKSFIFKNKQNFKYQGFKGMQRFQMSPKFDPFNKRNMFQRNRNN